jgi:hypothetical protein
MVGFSPMMKIRIRAGRTDEVIYVAHPPLFVPLLLRIIQAWLQAGSWRSSETMGEKAITLPACAPQKVDPSEIHNFKRRSQLEHSG